MATRWLTDDEQATWRAFIVAAHHVEAALDRQLLRDSGLPHAHYGILVALADAGGSARMGEVAAVLDFSPSRLAHAVAAIEKRGWVCRRECPDDRHGQVAELTAAGRDVLAAAAPGHVAEVRRIVFDVVPPDEQHALRSALTKILDALPHPDDDASDPS